MKVEMLAFSASDAATAKAAMKIIGEYFSDTVGAIERFRLFNSSRDFFSGMADAFSSADIIVSAATVDSFLEQKWAMLKALSLGSEINRAIVSEISQNGSVDDSAIKKHSIMPKDATVFCTADALYSGFAVKKGKQTLIYLPLDTELLPGLLDDCVLPYFTDIKHQKSAVAAAPAPVSAAATPKQVPQAEPKLHKEKKDSFPEATKALAEQGLSVAIGATQTSIYARKRVNQDPANGDLYLFSECDDERNEGESLKNYAARLSDTVRIQSKTDVGTVISNVYTSGGADGQMFVYVAVSDKDHARVKKVLAKENETAGGLVEASTKILFKMLQSYAETGGIPPEEAKITELEGAADESDGEAPTSAQAKSTGLKVIIGIAIALIMCLLIGFFFKDVKALFIDDSASDTQAIPEGFSTEAVLDAMLALSPDESESLSEVIENDGHLAEEEMMMRNSPEVIEAVYSMSTTVEETSEKTTDNDKATETTEKKTTAEVKTTAQEVTTEKTTTKKAEETTTEKKEEAAEKIETTTKESTTKESTTATTTEKDSDTTTETSSSGSFTFKTYGYGHGVGMSQLGALALGNSGGSNWTYDKILAHYYPSTTLSTDTSMPVLIYMNSSPVLLRTFIARVTNAEIGSSCKQATIEGVKAQIVAIYTFVKYDIDKGDNSFVTGQLAYNTNEPSSLIFDAVDAVLGQYLSYGGKTAFTPFYASSAGVTTSSASVWGGSYPYLMGGVSSPETVSERTVTITAEQMKKYVDNYNSGVSDKSKITLSGDPSQWIEIISHDGARGNVGYVLSIRVGNQTISGNSFRKMIGNATLRSHCFSFSYSD